MMKNTVYVGSSRNAQERIRGFACSILELVGKWGSGKSSYTSRVPVLFKAAAQQVIKFLRLKVALAFVFKIILK